ncbi:MAG: hypothetical protein QNL62_04315 [Gammaproteobacteria bacterium]|nr:hypothetical protein [Gammaproteobacteria bacterium]
MSVQVIKHREIHFCPLHANPNQAHSAVFIINDLSGVLMSHALDHHRIKIAYNLERITLEEIEAVLSNEGFHLDNSILSKIKRSIVFYCEEASLENSKNERLIQEVHDKHNSDVIYLRPKKKKLCDCRDHRPEHWRQYL